MTRAVVLTLAVLVADIASSQPLTPEQAKEEPLLFTAPGFDHVGEPKWDGEWTQWNSGGRTGKVEIVVRDAATGRPTPCRINVVGRDGHFYQAPPNRLSRFALTGEYPAPWVWGNRLGKAPYRYVGRFFYTTGETTVRTPAGAVRVEVWKGLEYRPETLTVEVPAGGVRRVEVKLTRGAPMAEAGYHPGDTHLHFPRENDEDDRVVFDVMEAEDLHFGAILAWNHPAGPYGGFMDRLISPQRSLGRSSIRTRGGFHIVSGQEYRNLHYGHMNLVLRDDLAVAGRSFDADTWPVYGEVGRETMARGGFAFMAHGGYGKEIYADAALGTINSVELLQFGVYRDIGLEGWYDMLNTGYRFSAHGASDYPPCRTMADCRTYVYHPTVPTLPEWLAGQAAGRSFFTTGPLLLLEVDGEKPGAQIYRPGAGPHRVKTRVRVRCEVTPVTDIDLIVNGRTVRNLKVPADGSRGRWLELEHTLELGESAWIAARAHSKSPGGQPDAEAHTNPVYVYLNDRAPYQEAAVDAWLAKIEDQITAHTKRDFIEKLKVLSYFQQARDVLFRLRAYGGMTAEANPAKLAGPEMPAKVIQGVGARTPHGISDRDMAMAKEEVSDRDVERASSFNRGDRRAVAEAAKTVVSQQLERSLKQYPTLAAWELRKTQLREEFLKGAELWPLPPKAPLRPIIHSRREHDGYSVENIAIESMPGFFCTGNLYRPLKPARPGPGVLCPHGHFKPLGRFREEQQIRCAHLARMGATVFSYSMVGWQDSRQTSHRDPYVLSLQVLNALAAIDYLSGLPEVDPKCIGITGASGGGSQSLYAALIDDRVIASCPVGIVYRWAAPLGCLCESGMPITPAADTNGIELSAAVAPHAQLFISIGGDGTRDFPETGFPFVHSIYNLYGRGDAVRDAHLEDEMHDFGPSKRKAMYDFFARHLGMTLVPEDAGTIAIERPRQMEVFNDSHPHPAHALQGTEAVGRAFKALPRTGRVLSSSSSSRN